jgi:hypothetical protein
MKAEPVTTGRKQDGTFAPGVSGNPNGRPKSTRHKLGERFLEALLTDFTNAIAEGDEAGVVAIRKMRDERPHDYAKMIASILPKELTGEDGAKLFSGLDVNVRR